MFRPGKEKSLSRVLLSAPDNRPWMYGRHLLVALRELGHDAELFDFRGVRRPDAGVLRAADAFRPQLHVIWKGERYQPETIRSLRDRGIYTVLWHSDDNVPTWLPPLAQASDLCCVQSAGMLPALRAAGIDSPEQLLEGITPSCFSYDRISRADHRRYDCEVVFIGTMGRRPHYLRRISAVDRLIREGIRVRWWGRSLPFRLTAPRDWFSPVRRAWGGGRVWGAAYAKACHCAKIMLALPAWPDLPSGLSKGAFIATGLGAFYLSLYRNGMEEYFELGREVAVFHNEDEMVEQVRRFLADDAGRRAIAEAGRRRTLGQYTNHHAFRRLFDLIAQRGGPQFQADV